MPSKLTLGVRNTEGVQAFLRQYGAGVQRRVRKVSKDSKARWYNTAQALCPRDTNYMAEHMVAEDLPSGLGWFGGFRRTDFVGRVNPVNGRLITEFYPFFQEFGTMYTAAQPCIYPAWDAERPRFLAELRRALRDR